MFLGRPALTGAGEAVEEIEGAGLGADLVGALTKGAEVDFAGGEGLHGLGGLLGEVLVAGGGGLPGLDIRG